jgi:taurine dioxygenase
MPTQFRQSPLIVFVAYPKMGLLDLTGPQTVFWAAAKRMAGRAIDQLHAWLSDNLRGGVYARIEGVGATPCGEIVVAPRAKRQCERRGLSAPPDALTMISFFGDHMKLHALAPTFGAAIEQLDLRTIDDDGVSALHAALLEHGLLVIRGKTLTPREQVAASRLFGELETFPANTGQVAGVPQIFRVASRSGEGYVDVGRYWHSDGSFRDAPTPMSIWHSVVQPGQGGDTLFTDLREAYAQLPAAIKEDIEPLVSYHRNGAAHRLAMDHPHTGERVLYLNIGLTSAIGGFTPERSRIMIDAVDRHLSREGATYRHQWLPGDFVVADNFRVAHRATPIGRDQKRILDRTTVRSGAAFWEALPVSGASVAAA